MYFKANQGKLSYEDNVVRGLLTHGSWWGLDALARSPFAYIDAELPQDCHRVLLHGNPYEVEKFVEKAMREGNPNTTAAKLKFLFVMVPLRSPMCCGLDPSEGLKLVSRVLTASADVYAQTQGKDERQKKRWMSAFMEVCNWMIQDVGMLPGMFKTPPSKDAVESLVSTELFSVGLFFYMLDS